MKKSPSQYFSIKRKGWLAGLGLFVFMVSVPFIVLLSKGRHTLNSQAAAGSLPDQLFSPSSPWNTPIGTNVQLDPNSSAMVQAISGGLHHADMYGFGMPIYTSTANDPSYTVIPSSGDPLFNSYQPIHIPDTAAPAPGDSPTDADHWLFIYDTTKNLIFEMWMTQKNGSNWITNTGNVYSPTGDGVLQSDMSLQDGNGASYFGGVVRDVDAQRGYINHALSFVSNDTASSFRYPMHASDGNGSSASAIPMGARLQLDPSVDCTNLTGASQGEKMVCQALETYGGYMRDSGGVSLTIYFEGEDLSDPNRNPPNGSPGNGGRSGGVFGNIGLSDGQELIHIPWNKLRVLKAWNSFTPITNTSPLPTAGITSSLSRTPPTPTVFGGVPSPACLGSCPTLIPSSVISIQPMPTETIIVSPSQSQLQPTPTSKNNNNGQKKRGAGNNKGLISDIINLILHLLQILLNLIQSVLGGNNH